MPSIIDGSNSAVFNTPLPIAQGGMGGTTGFSNIVQSMVRLNNANGYGSTNTANRRFTNVVTNQGTDITYADSATLGASFTVNTNGVYSISYCDQFTAAQNVAISKNSVLTAPNLAAADILAISTATTSGFPVNPSWCGYLIAGTVIRATTDSSGVTGANPNMCQFTISRVG